MAASGDWIAEVLELVLRALFGLMKNSGESWWPFECLVATTILVVIVALLTRHYRRRAKTGDGEPGR